MGTFSSADPESNTASGPIRAVFGLVSSPVGAPPAFCYQVWATTPVSSSQSKVPIPVTQAARNAQRCPAKPSRTGQTSGAAPPVVTQATLVSLVLQVVPSMTQQGVVTASLVGVVGQGKWLCQMRKESQVSTNEQATLPLKFEVEIEGLGKVSATVEQLSILVAEQRKKAYAERKAADSAAAHSAGKAAEEQHLALFLANLTGPMSLTAYAEAQREAKRLGNEATRVEYRARGYGECKHDGCQQLTSPLAPDKDGNPQSYRFCNTHQPTPRGR